MENNKINQPQYIHRQEIIDLINKYNTEDHFYPANDLEKFIIYKFKELCEKTGEFVNRKCQSIDTLKQYMTEKEQTRALNCIRAEKIKYMEELCQYTAWDLLKAPNFGIKSLIAVRDAWIKSGHTIKEDTGRIYKNGNYKVAYFELIW